MNHPDNSINSQLVLVAISIQLLETRLQNNCFPQPKKKERKVCFAFFPPIYRACRWVKINIPVHSCNMQETLTVWLNCPRRLTSRFFFFKGKKMVFSIRHARTTFPTSETISVARKHTLNIYTPAYRSIKLSKTNHFRSDVFMSKPTDFPLLPSAPSLRQFLLLTCSLCCTL